MEPVPPHEAGEYSRTTEGNIRYFERMMATLRWKQTRGPEKQFTNRDLAIRGRERELSVSVRCADSWQGRVWCVLGKSEARLGCAGTFPSVR